jgi:hypothetical protein
MMSMKPQKLDRMPNGSTMDEDLKASSVLAWISLGDFVNENQEALEFKNHRFMIDIYADDSPDIVCIKSAQVGFSVYAILKSFHELKYEKRNILYALPTKNVVQDFVVPKVNPLIMGNKVIASDVGSDSVSQKRFGDRFIYFKGGSEREAISVSADTLVIDEYDRMPSMNIVTMFDSRLQAAKEPRRRRFSNPSAIGFGVDALYKESCMFHWFVTCHHCGHERYIEYEQGDDMAHYIDKEQYIYACGVCGLGLSDDDRRNGRWVAKWPNRKRHGYWISQMMAPWVTAERIIEQEKEMDTATFHAFVLGKAYTPSDLLIDRETILKALRPGKPRQRGLVMGSDIGKPHWYWIGNADGLLKWGRAKDWDELEYLFNFYQCEAWVMDSMPEFTQVQAMLRKYPGKAYACQFNKDRAALGIIRWQTGDKRGFVYVDRTKVIDRVVTELNSGDIKIYGNESDAAEFINHAGNMYRSIETDEKGGIKIDWLTKEGKPDHLVFGLVYWRVALEKAFSGINAGVVETPLIHNATAPTVAKDGTIPVDLDLAESFERARQ